MSHRRVAQLPLAELNTIGPAETQCNGPRSSTRSEGVALHAEVFKHHNLSIRECPNPQTLSLIRDELPAAQLSDGRACGCVSQNQLGFKMVK